MFIYLCICLWGHHQQQCACGGQRAVGGCWFFLFTLQVPGIELRPSGLTTSACTQSAILLVPLCEEERETGCTRLALNLFWSPGCLWACASAASTSPPNAGISVLPHQAWCEAPTSQKVVIGFCTSPASLLCSASGLFLCMFCLQGTGPIFTVKKNWLQFGLPIIYQFIIE